MQPIHPITDKTCRSLYGKPVLVFLNDGSEIYGILSRIEKNKLFLNDDVTSKLNSATKKTKKTISKSKVKTKTKQAKPLDQTSFSGTADEGYSSFGLPLMSFGGMAPGYQGAIDIQLENIAAMFSE
jgi:small nuclear ribonucleoprotein (snRNP)-like protein